MPSGTLQVYTALAENAAPLPGVTVLVLILGAMKGGIG